jgi:Tol biopolymer transport system component
VLYEMLTGRPVFEGESAGEILGGVFKQDPDWSRLPADTPAPIRRLLRRCLQKDRRLRLKDIGDARVEIDEALNEPVAAVATTSVRPRRPERWPWIAVAVFSLGAATLSAIVLFVLRPAPAQPEMRVEITTPPTSDLASLAISGDGQTLAFAAAADGQTRLWLRPLNAVSARALAGTENAEFPFWSPDGKSLGFFADGKLKRIELASGSIQTLASASTGRGGSWSREGVIVFAPTAVGQIFRIPAEGGPPTAITHPARPSQFGHVFPRFLPDGRQFVFFARGNAEGRGIYLGSFDGTEKRLVAADSAAVLAPSGHLLFVRQGALFAQRFEWNRATPVGEPVAVGDAVGVGQEQGPVGLAASMAGPIAYRTAVRNTERQFIWFDRSGNKSGVAGGADTAFPTDPELSLDGRRIAIERAVGGVSDIWIVDAARGVLNRVTSEAASALYPVWSRDGRQIVFCSTRKGVYDLYRRSSSDAGGDELLLESAQNKAGNDISPDGRFLLYRVTAEQTGFDLWAMPLEGDRKPFVVAQTKFDEREGQFSPDGKWIAFQSNETERFEIYVQQFPGPGGRTRVSTNGGAQARWRRDGRELFYVGLDGKLMAVPIRLAANAEPVEAAAPVTLFQTHIVSAGPRRQQYAVAPDGQRFLINSLTADAVTPPITLILNWRSSK